MSTTTRASFAAVLFLLAAASLAQAPDAGPYRVGGNVTRPEKISGESGVYTEIARRARVVGVVILELVIDEKGDVTDTRVLKGLPMGLDKAALDAVQTWRFKPATLDGRPVPVYYTVTMNFQLTTDLNIGPRFGKLLQDDPELGELVRNSRYREALDLLDEDRPASPETRLARAYVLLGLREVAEAWQEAQGLDSPEHELLYSLGETARQRAAEDSDKEVRAELLDVGLQALTRALEVKKDDYWTLSAKSRLLRDKAELTGDERERKTLLDEAEALSDRAAAVRPKAPSPNG